MSKYTRGPWDYKRNLKTGHYHIIGPGITVWDEGAGQTTHDNAKLVASAPELLNALEYALSVIDSLPCTELHKLEDHLDEEIDFPMMMKAIAKAKAKS